MNAPAFLPAIISALMLLVAGYAAWRLALAPALGLARDIETDALLLAAAVAGAGLVSSWAHTLPRAAWSVLFAIAACCFAVRARAAKDQSRRGMLISHAGGCAVLVYMFLAGVAPSTLHGSTAGQYTMAPMPGMYVDQTITHPAIGLACVAVMALCAATTISKLSPVPQDRSAGTAVFAARSVEACRIFLTLALAYAILSKVV